MKCPFCFTEMVVFSQPELEGKVETIALCPHCGVEVGGADIPFTREEVQACHNLRQAIKNRGGVTRGS